MPLPAFGFETRSADLTTQNNYPAVEMYQTDETFAKLSEIDGTPWMSEEKKKATVSTRLNSQQ